MPACRRTAYRWRVAMARIRQAEGDLDGALDLLDEAERLYVERLLPERAAGPGVAGTGAGRGRGGLGEALGWARERGLSVDDDLSYLREFEHITLARVLLAQYTTERAEGSARRGDRDSWSACCERRRRASGRAASSRSWCCRRSPTRREATSPAALAAAANAR